MKSLHEIPLLYEIIYEFVQLTIQLTKTQFYGFNRMNC